MNRIHDNNDRDMYFCQLSNIALLHYTHRFSLQNIIPFGNSVIFRYLLGWMMPPKVSLLKVTETKAITNLYENNHIIQDLLVPVKYLKESIRKFHDAVQVRSKPF